MQFEGNPTNPFGAEGAITLGNAINYVGNAKPNDLFPTYAANNYLWSRGATFDSVILGSHEGRHTKQSEIFGPLYLPLYFVGGVGAAALNGSLTLNPINKYNPMEGDADHTGNQQLKQLRNEN